MILLAGIAALFAAVSRDPEWTGMLQIWVIHSVAGVALSAPFVKLGRKRVHWGLLDLLAFLLPFAVWVALMNISDQGKTLANLIEPLIFGLAIPVAALIRVIVGPHAEERASSISLVAALCLVAAGVYKFTPALPE
jgi:hypothetical protein